MTLAHSRIPRLTGAVVASLVSCVVIACRDRGPSCETIGVRIDDATVIQIPVRAEYCLWTPDEAACCRSEGTRCDALADAPRLFFSIERPPGCATPSTRRR